MKYFIQHVIPKRAKECHFCKKKFHLGEEVQSILSEIKNEWQRIDTCSQCVSPSMSFEIMRWKIVFMEIPKEGKEKFNDTFQLLVQLTESEEIHLQYESFILAQYLLRQKVLREDKKEINKEGESFALYENKLSGEGVLVRQFNLLKLPLQDIHHSLALKMR